MSTQTIKVPDISNFENVEVIEILVSPGNKVNQEDSLITVESDKASMEIPAPFAGTIQSISINIGDSISEGSTILEMDVVASEASTPAETVVKEQKQSQTETEHTRPQQNNTQTTAANYTGRVDLQTEVLVLGAGPGGYTAAFRAADLGKKVILVEKHKSLGGVCLNVGCIPSKALLHVAEVMTETEEFAELGVKFNKPEVNLKKLRKHKNNIVGKLTNGLKVLSKQRKITVVQGYGKFTSSHTLELVADDGSSQIIGFENCIIAAGSSVIKPAFIPWQDDRVWDSTDALKIPNVPKRLLIVGGGIIGLEMATVYHALGSKITIVSLDFLPGADQDLVRPYQRTIKKRYENIYLDTLLGSITPSEQGLACEFKGGKGPQQDTFDNVLIAIGRSPNGKFFDAEKAGVSVDEQGFINVNSQMQTNIEHIYAIGDIIGQPMLAHKATHEAKIAAEVISGFNRHFDARTIASVAYTNPEIAWCGQTEEQLKTAGTAYEKGVFPWVASGRAISMGAEIGTTKVLYDKQSKQMLGAGIVGKNAGELIAEAVLAVEMGAEMEDIALTIHAHPTLAETLNFATEVAEGSCTDIYAPKK
ncbi:MAG: dihydrolipoyl dehydrogenase [Pseudomonadota bacterium]